VAVIIAQVRPGAVAVRFAAYAGGEGRQQWQEHDHNTMRCWSARGRLGRGSFGPGLGGHCRLIAGVGACASGPHFAPLHEGLVVVVTFFAGGFRPIKAGWWILICHPVLATSRGDIVVGEN
jgi:hypothetical protein